MYFLHHTVEYVRGLVNVLVDDCTVKSYEIWTPDKVREHCRGLPSSSVRSLRPAEAAQRALFDKSFSLRSRFCATLRAPQTALNGLLRLSEGGLAILAGGLTFSDTGAPQPQTDLTSMLLLATYQQVSTRASAKHLPGSIGLCYACCRPPDCTCIVVRPPLRHRLLFCPSAAAVNARLVLTCSAKPD